MLHKAQDSRAGSTDGGPFDVVIVGAGISGINTAYHIQKNFPALHYCILEARAVIGGTWDLFRYPGIRSDTDLPTFSFAWNPWQESHCVASGASIANYLCDSASLAGIDRHIKFSHSVASASWSSKSHSWQLAVQAPGNVQITLDARFVILCSGYYDYKEPLQPKIPGLYENFKGTIVHPQFWPEDLDYANKRVVIIGSGATAITLLPSLAAKAEHVTMLQRSPTYIMTIDNTLGNSWYHKVLPRSWSYYVDRLFFIAFINISYYFCRTFPARARQSLQNSVAKQLPVNVPLDPHFKPLYEPWDQRVCFTPDGDFFQAIRDGKAGVETGRIRTATETQLVLESGKTLDADIVVTATGLNLKVGGRISFSLDGQPVDLCDRFTWHTTLLQDIPNLAFMMGYVNASWTLATEASSLLLCRILRHMKKNDFKTVVPRVSMGSDMQSRPVWKVDATYVREAKKTPVGDFVQDLNIDGAIDQLQDLASHVLVATESTVQPSTLDRGGLIMTVRETMDVQLAIAPWNSSLLLAMRAVTTPIACGNTVILKASELSPLVHHLMGTLFRDAGFPPGVLNVAQHGRDDAQAVVDALVSGNRIRKVNFLHRQHARGPHYNR
ncbi:hypothetical protein Sste5344_010083 [Sporothrix stenoceras]